MIDPNNIINFNRTDAELEELILFLVCVAGKKASTVARNLDFWLHGVDYMEATPFVLIRARDYVPSDGKNSVLYVSLKASGFGQHTKLERAFRELANSNLNLRTCTKEDLMSIHGIGRKSASCFLAWTRKGEDVAILDTHLLKFLRSEQEKYKDAPLFHSKVLQDVVIPKSTPTGRLYDKLEKMYLDICKIYGKDPTEFDLEIWKFYSQGLDKVSE